jgi:hypothetical protein
MSATSRELSPPHAVEPIILGIIGSRPEKSLSFEKLIQNILHLIIEHLGRLPDRVLIPSEGDSSMNIMHWAERLKISHQEFYADWKGAGKSAAIRRDARIVNDSTHLLVFLSSRSERLEKLAERAALSKKNRKIVFTSSYQDSSLELLEVDDHSPSHQEERGRK